MPEPSHQTIDPLPTFDFVALNQPSSDQWRAVEACEPSALDATLPRPLREVLRLSLQLDDRSERKRASVLLVHFLSRAPDEPLAFARATIEWARQRSCLLKDTAALAEVEALLADPQLDELGAAESLRALVAAYQADDQSYAGDSPGAETILSELRRDLPTYPPEIAAMILEISSDVMRRWERWMDLPALQDLDQAEQLLGISESIPGRRAGLLLRRARVLMQAGRPAHLPLLAAVEDLPIGVDARLWLEVRHCLVAVQISRGEVAAAEALMTAIAPEYAAVRQDRGLESERLHLQANILLQTGRPAAAEAPLERSLSMLLELGAVSDAFLALDKLLEVWELTGRPPHRRRRLEALLRQILGSPGLRRASYVATCRRLERAEELGLTLPDVSDVPRRMFG